jgi:TetR/AcrR family transcriptional regulator, transcriptional repressor for nem operon
VRIAPVMAEAGLTHGGFYAHFADRDDLLAQAFAAAAESGRSLWFGGLDETDGRDFLAAALGRYLSARHRATPEDGCVVAAAASELPHAAPAVRSAASRAVEQAADRLGRGRDRDEALALLALCVGGVALARAVDDPRLSDDLLRACRRFGLRACERAEDEDGGDDRDG